MTRSHGRGAKGERVRSGCPHGHWKTTTFIGALTCQGMVAPCVLDKPVNANSFAVYVEHFLVPELKPGSVVVMDNLSSHKGKKIQELIESAGATLLFLPPYSPDFNPIEKAFAKMKALLRKAEKRTIPELWDEIGRICDLFLPTECRNYFRSCGYDPI